MAKIFDNILKLPGAYIITYAPTGLFYIGSSSNLRARLWHPDWLLNNNRHYVKRLQEAFTSSDDYCVEVYLTVDREQAFEVEGQLLQLHFDNQLITNTRIDPKSQRGIPHTHTHTGNSTAYKCCAERKDNKQGGC